MKHYYIYKIIVCGKETTIEGHEKSTAESIVRGIMCWYGVGTVFTVIDPDNKVSVFRKVPSPDPVKGYCELVKGDRYEP